MVRFINSRLSIPARLWLMVVVSAIPDVLLTGLYVQQSSLDIAFAQKEIDGTNYLAGLWTHFASVAETGATNRPAPLSTDYDAEFTADDSAKAYESARDVTEKLDAGKALIGTVADNSNLTLDPDLDSFYAMDADTVRLPGIVAASIAIGKAAAEPVGTPSRLVHIAFAVNRLEISAADANASLTAAMKNNKTGSTRTALAGLTAELKRASDALAGQGRALLEGGAAPDLDADKVQLLARTDTTWLATNAELKRLLQSRVTGFHNKLAVNLLIAAASLLVAYWLSKTISAGLSRRVSGLVAVMKRLVAEDATPTIPYLDDRNETGQIAKTLLAFKNSLAARKQLEGEQVAAGEQTLVVDAVAMGLDALARGRSHGHAVAELPSRLRSDPGRPQRRRHDATRKHADDRAQCRCDQGGDDGHRRLHQQAGTPDRGAGDLAARLGLGARRGDDDDPGRGARCRHRPRHRRLGAVRGDGQR